MIKKIVFTGITALVLLSSATLSADEITEQMNDAIKSYQAKDYKGAMDELKFITAKLQKLDTAENQKLLPPPLEGWTFKAGDNETQMAMSMMGGGTSIKGSYSKGKESIVIEVLANSPMISMLAMSINNPMIMGNDPSLEPYRYKKSKGMIKKGVETTEITLLVVGQVMIKLTGKYLKEEAVLEQYLEALDIKKIKEVLLQ